MKQAIHPKVNKVVFVDTSAGVEFVTTSTLKSEKTKEIDGVTYYIIPMEISSASHPFYTGKQTLVDTARRIEKFQTKMEKVKEVSQSRQGKRVKRAKRATAKEEGESK